MAKERYAMLGVETDQALDTLAQIPISLHCWQGDDLAGFETPNAELGGGLAATGNYKSPKSFLSNLSTHSKHRYSQIGVRLTFSPRLLSTPGRGRRSLPRLS
jgi:L-rhamnose isomerase